MVAVVVVAVASVVVVVVVASLEPTRTYLAASCYRIR